MKVYRSNRVERLLDALVGVVSEPLHDPMAGECVVVHSRGMGTWLSQRLAERLGVWAGGRFPFPRRFVDEILRAALGERAPLAGFGADSLLWPVMAELPDHLEHGAFAEVARFVADGATGDRGLFQLARRIASTFEQYVVFRPEMVLVWEGGRDDHWQARLWRSVNKRLQGRHPAALARDLFDALGRQRPDGLPERLCVFGASTLPPFYLRIFDALDRFIPVHLFLVSPSRAYWAEIRSHRELLRRAGDEVPEVDHEAPALLASLGTVGRDFQLVLESTSDYVEPRDDLYVDPGQHTMLAALQSDILEFRHRGLQAGDDPPLQIAASDRSIAVHACHSPMREVEVLHDQLLDLLAADPTLQPHDIAILCSNVEAYAPLVEAVFEREPGDPTFVPYCVADRALRADSPVVEAFHRIVDLVGGRVTASEVVDLLTLPPIQQRFAIAPDEVDAITAWVAEAGIRWGIDESHRRHHKQPGLRENTWRFGLDRLFLGYAMPRGDDGKDTFGGVLPYDEVEGQPTLLLGRFAELCEHVFDLVLRLEDPRSPRKWQEVLTAAIDAVLAGPSETAWEILQLRTALDAIASDAEAAEFRGAVPLSAMVELVDSRLAEDSPPRGFLAGGATFCELLPMRSIPFRVVCLLGMGDTDFPRSSPRVGFDLIAARPRPGDRSRRTDDRYLFLEALLAARERVLVFHVGSSVQDNSPIPPSVVVSELLDELAQGFQAAGGVRDHVVLRHPMQPFSPRYFGADDDTRLFSFEASYAAGAKALVGETEVGLGPALLTEPLPDPRHDTETDHQLPLSRLIRFFRMPAADLLKRRLGLYLDDYSRDHSDREPMELDPLDEWRLGAELLAHELRGVPPSDVLALLRAGGDLPLGTPGQCRYEDLVANVQPIVAQAKTWCRGEPLDHLEIDLAVGRTRLVGTIGSRFAQATTTVQYARANAKHLLRLWIEHLATCITAPPDQEHVSVLVAKADKAGLAKVCRLRHVEDAQLYLGKLIDLYWIGQREPLLLFPKTSKAFCQTLIAKKDQLAAFEAARKVWTDRQLGERDDPSLRRLFGDTDVLSQGFTMFDHPMTAGDFPGLAIDVFCPLLTHLEEEG